MKDKAIVGFEKLSNQESVKCITDQAILYCINSELLEKLLKIEDKNETFGLKELNLQRHLVYRNTQEHFKPSMLTLNKLSFHSRSKSNNQFQRTDDE